MVILMPCLAGVTGAADGGGGSGGCCCEYSGAPAYCWLGCISRPSQLAVLLRTFLFFFAAPHDKVYCGCSCLCAERHNGGSPPVRVRVPAFATTGWLSTPLSCQRIIARVLGRGVFTMSTSAFQTEGPARISTPTQPTSTTQSLPAV
ncbi:hypothetical protein GQ54DRAFT_177640 [Martensiomyces pterosporus]|nr:hypothetical protein GQ54DRAFT_177640 [Martensiomyces pterosporus]